MKRANFSLLSAKTLTATLLVGVQLAGMACGPTVSLPTLRPDDAGDASFARQAKRILHGAPVAGYQELEVLTDLIQATDRETLVRTLMEQQAFRDYWTQVLVERLRIHLDGTKNQVSCYGPAMLPAAPTTALSDHILGNPPSVPFPGGAYKMSDVVSSGVVADNMYTIYRAHLFAMENRSVGFPQQERRNDLGATFGRVYLNRELGCLLCHNSDNSLSGIASGWKRTHPITGSFEAALYGSASGSTPEQAFAVFRTDVLGGGGAQKPWGMESCGTFKPTVGNDPEDVSAYFAGPLGKRVTIRNVAEILQFGYLNLESDGLDRSLPIAEQEQCDFCATGCDGVSVSPDAPANAVNAAQVKTLLVSTCATSGCHIPASSAGGLAISNDNQWFTDLVNEPATASGEIRVIPGNAADSYLIKKLRGAPGTGPQMPFGGTPLAESQIEMVENWINDIPSGAACNVCETLECSQPFPKRVEGHEAFAFLVAARIVENVWDEVMGHPLTIANYFPRNEGQQRVLWNLTEFHFIPHGWSLKELLVRILTSDYFNRKAPRFSTGTTAYELPMVYDPWVEADPREPPVSEPGYDPTTNPESHNNSMGEGVYRFTAQNLFASIHEAFDWPAPQRFPPATGYPNAALQKAMGRFFNDNESGGKVVDFQALLRWESVHGVCEKPTGVVNDWMDQLIADVASFPAADPGGPLTVEDLIVVVRNRILSDGTLATTTPEGLTVTEVQDLTGFFGVPLNTEANDVTDLETKLRGYCGVLAETPQFLLAGITPSGLGPEPRLNVCTGTPCSYQEICQALEPAVEALLPTPPADLTCNTDSLEVSLGLTVRRAIELCPREICTQIHIPRFDECLRNPARCPIVPPACDPRSASADFCGAPLSERTAVG